MKRLLASCLAMFLFCGTEGITCHEHELPVQLTSFTAVRTSFREVRLQWSTASETNNYGFFVMRNGITLDSFTPGHGTTTIPQEYEWTDVSASPYERFTYRLRQVDLDGTPHLSDSVSVPRIFSQLIPGYER